MLLLHCFTCSLQGTRLDHSRISSTIVAEIIKEKIKLPLDASMFKTYDPDNRGFPQWPLTSEWDKMYHHGHQPWEIVRDEDVLHARMKNGGPERIFTDKGWIYLDSEGIIPEGGREQQVDPENVEISLGQKEGDKPIEHKIAEVKEYYCDICGAGPFADKRKRHAHKMGAHRK